MNMDSTNKWLMLAANIGVIAGIAFLAIEISQNSDQLAAQTRNTMFGARAVLENDFANNIGGIAEIVTKARRGETLTDTEAARLVSRQYRVLRTFEYMIQESTPEIVRMQAPYMVAYISSTSGALDRWKTSPKDAFDPKFVSFMEKYVLPSQNP